MSVSACFNGGFPVVTSTPQRFSVTEGQADQSTGDIDGIGRQGAPPGQPLISRQPLEGPHPEAPGAARPRRILRSDGRLLPQHPSRLANARTSG